MKFTEGYWRVREGFSALHPVQVHDVELAEDGSEVRLYSPTRRVEHRGDTLSNPELTLTVRAPMPGVLAVTIEHFTGAREVWPDFALTDDARLPVVVTELDEHVVVRSGDLELWVTRATFRLEYRADGRVLTSSERKGIGRLTGPDGTTYTHEQLSLGIGETVHGLGERFGHLVKNGQVVDMWNDDSGTSSDRSYKNVPFYLTTAGFGVFVDHPGDVSFEVGSEKVGRVQFSVPGERLTYLVIHGPGPKDVLERYTALTGRPPRLPAWSFGLWLTTSFTTDYDGTTVAGFIDGMAERDIPLSVFHYDCFWMREFRWVDFQWDERAFGDPVARIRDHHERQGVKVCVWINPYIGARSPLFTEGRTRGYLLMRPDGDVYQTDFWQSGMALVDFTNPEACAWYRGHLERLLDMGVDCFKTDFGESVPTDVVWHDGSDPVRMHNYYTHLYNRTVHDLLVERRGPGEAVLFARSATAGGQTMPVHWGGDCESTYPAMAESLRGGLSLAASGFGYWAHDIGGFEGDPTPDLYKRWVAFGLLSSHSRLHGSGTVRVPWVVDDEAVDVLRHFTRLKLSLLPYLAATAEQATGRGTPMMRPMVLEFPHDPAVAYLDRQYMLGDDLLVAPVLRADGVAELYVPAGTWTNLLDGSTVVGPGWVCQEHDVFSLPLLVRPGAVVPVQPGRTGTDGDLTEGLRLVIRAPQPGTRLVRVPRGFDPAAGEVVFEVTVDGSQVVARGDCPGGFELDVDGTVVQAVEGVARTPS